MLPDTALKTVAPAAVAAAVASFLGTTNVPVNTIFLPAKLGPRAFALAFALAFGFGSGSATAFLLTPFFPSAACRMDFAAAFAAALAATDIPAVPVVCASWAMCEVFLNFAYTS